MVLQNYQNLIEIHIVAFGVGFKCPCKIHLITQWGGEQAMVPPDFGSSFNPISQPEGADYAHHITTGTPGFSDLPTALLS